MTKKPEIAVVIPCHNEENTIVKVIEDFRKQLPEAVIYVFDNCCSDHTAEIARNEGSIVISEQRKGKGFVVESIFHSIHADYYVMVDGDDTYPAEKVHELLVPVLHDQADMAVGTRFSQYAGESFRAMHVIGNRLVRFMVNMIFNANLTDIMSGYRAFNCKVVQRIPIVSSGFEVETELTVQMLYYKMNIVEIPIPYRPRPAGSNSKLRTLPDGMRVLWKIFSLFRNFKPLTFFGGIGILGILLALWSAVFIVRSYADSGYVAEGYVIVGIFSATLFLLSSIMIVLGLLLHAINWRFKELHNVMIRHRE